MKFLDRIKKIGKGVGKTIESPFKKVGKIVGKGASGLYRDVKSVVHTVHKDAKGIFKGGYSVAKDVSSGVNTGISQLTSPIGLISIAVIVGAVVLISMNKK